MGAIKLSYYNEEANFLGVFSKKEVSGNFFSTSKRVYDYYPFGMLLPNRHESTNEYRYGFNGMEKDDELYSVDGSSYDFGARMYNSRIGRWMSVDPLGSIQPSWSPYKSFLDNPIIYQDPNGETEYLTITIKDEKSGKSTTFTKVVSNDVFKGNLVMVDTYGGWTNVRNWYDQQTNYTITVDQNGDYSYSAPITKLVNTDVPNITTSGPMLNSSAYANLKRDILDTNLEGDGGSQSGGIHMVTDGGGAEPTKFKSLSSTYTINIESLLATLGALGGSKGMMPGKSMGNDFADMINDLAGLAEKTKEVIDDSKKATPEEPLYDSDENRFNPRPTQGDTLKYPNTNKGTGKPPKYSTPDPDLKPSSKLHKK